MKKLLLVLLICKAFQGSTQFIINKQSGNEFDGYETRVYTKPIATDGQRACPYETIFEIQKWGLYFWTHCIFDDSRNYIPIKFILTINGKNKEINVPVGVVSQSRSYNPPPDNYKYQGTAYSISLQWEKQYDSRIPDDFILDLANATSMSVKIVNSPYRPFEDVYFKMSLNPSNTIKALNTFGFYDRAIKHLKEKESKERAEKDRLDNEKKAEQQRKSRADKLITEIDNLLNNDVVKAAKIWNENKSILEIEKVPSTTYTNLRNKLIDFYRSKSISINQYIDENQIKLNANNLKNLKDGEYQVVTDFNSNKTIPKEFESLKWELPNNILDAECCGIKIPCLYNINITSRDSILISTEYFSSSKKPIFSKNDKKFFFKSNSGLSAIDFKYDKEVPKGLIKLTKNYKNVKSVNNVLIDEKKYIVQEQIGIINKEK